MSRPGTNDTLNLRQAAKLCGVSYRFAWKRHKLGKFPGVKHPTSRFVLMRRAELIAWMASNDYDPDFYRPLFQPPNGHLFTVGLRRSARVELRGCNPTHCQSLLNLGMRLSVEPCWAIIFGFEGLGRDRAVEAAAELRGMVDCPLLIAVAGEDEAGRLGDPVKVFDQTYSEPIDYTRLAEAMRRLYKGVPKSRPRVADPEANRFNRVGGG